MRHASGTKAGLPFRASPVSTGRNAGSRQVGRGGVSFHPFIASTLGTRSKLQRAGVPGAFPLHAVIDVDGQRTEKCEPERRAEKCGLPSRGAKPAWVWAQVSLLRW